MLSREVAIMAGGEGRRLRPVTGESLPKALAPIGDRPLLELIVERLRGQGFRRFAFCVRHLAESLVEHFGDGSGLGVSIRYSVEGEPLGTAGGLSLLGPPGGSLLVVNGDVLTSHDFAGMVRELEESGAAAVAGLRRHEYRIPFGVADLDPAGNLAGLREKPLQSALIFAGACALSPRALAALEPGRREDMPDLLNKLIASGEAVRPRLIAEPWVDAGTPATYAEALRLFGNGSGPAPEPAAPAKR